MRTPPGSALSHHGVEDHQELPHARHQRNLLGLAGPNKPATAKTLEKDFARNGLQTEVMAQMMRDNDATRRIVFLLLRGFMSLGLVVGYAASLLTTFLPARQASKVYPAEALHYE